MLLIADDLTGAADSAVAFACHGHAARILLGAKEVPASSEGLTAINLESRDMPEEQLAGSNAILRSALDSAELCYRKIDSMFRGNTFTEIALIARMQLGIPMVLAPAHPTLGRRVLQGDLHWRDSVQEGIVAIETSLHQRGIHTTLIEQSKLSCLSQELARDHAENTPVFLCDAGTQADLEQIVDVVLSTQRKVLWCGSGGLALALAKQVSSFATPQTDRHPHGNHVLFFIGSDHPVTLRQSEALRQMLPENATIFQVLRARTSETEIQTWLGNIDRNNIGCVFMTGGDTAMQVCRAMGVQELQVLSEFEPGVPLTRIRGGILDGVDALLKSGGFGQPDLLCRIAKEYGSIKENLQ